MPIPSVTPLPTPPSIASPTTFDTLAEAFTVALGTFGTELNASITQMNLTSTQLNAMLAAAGFASTSTTSMTVAAGTKTFTIGTGLAFVPGAWVTVANTAAPTTTYMIGVVSAYTTGTGSMTVVVPSDGIAGAGTYTAWTVALSGPRGPAGVGIPGFVDITSATPTFAIGNAYRLRTRVTNGALPASPGLGGYPIRLLDGTGSALTLAHSIFPNGTEKITVAGTIYDDFSLNSRDGIFTLVPITGGWEVKKG